MSSNDDQQRFDLSVNRNISGVSKFKDEERLTDIRSPNDESHINKDINKAQDKNIDEKVGLNLAS